MSGFLLDTNVLSEFSRRDSADPAVRKWLMNADDSSLFTSILALAEIRWGIERLDPGKRRQSLSKWFTEELVSSFGPRILPVSHAIADRWAILSARLERQGRPLPTVDGLIAATAPEHGLTVVTRNVKDFVATEAAILNPWNE